MQALQAMLVDNLSSVGQFRFLAYVQKCRNWDKHWLKGWNWLKSALYICPKVGQYCVQLSNEWTMLCKTVQWLENTVSICPMVGQCCFQLSNGWTVLCSTVQWSDSAVSNCQMVGQCCVQLSNGRTLLCSTVQWLNNGSVCTILLLILF